MKEVQEHEVECGGKSKRGAGSGVRKRWEKYEGGAGLGDRVRREKYEGGAAAGGRVK